MKPGRINIVPTERYNPGEKVFFRIFRNNKSFWKVGTIKRRVENMIYIVKGPQFTHKRHLNQLRRCILNEVDSSPSEETLIDVIYDAFNILTPLAALEIRHSKRKRKATNLIIVNLKCRRY